MSIPASLLTTTCDIYSPFGAASPSATAVPCRLVADLYRGRGTSPNNTVAWTHFLDVQDTVTVLDGCTRTVPLNTINYADGDEVRIPSGGSARYVVVWVEKRNIGTVNQYKRVFLMRHSA
jgi:hypothetical protein